MGGKARGAGNALDQPGGFGHFLEVLGVLLEEAELLAAFSGQFPVDRRRPRILGKGRQHGTGELQAAAIGRVLQPADDAEALRVALVALEVGPLGRREGMAFKQAGITEPLADRIFAGMAEGRIADVVRQAGGGNDGAEICLLYTSPSPRDMRRSRMPSSA